MKIDFKQLSIKDLEGAEYNSPANLKTLGNLLYLASETIEQENYARAIHAGHELDITSTELQDLKRLVESSGINPPIVRREILNFLTTIK